MLQLEGLDLIREKVRIRDNRTCQKCGKKWKPGTRRLDVHHLNLKMESVRSYKYDRTHMHELITLCHKCHLGLPHHRKKMSEAITPTTIQVKRAWKIFNLRSRGHTLEHIGSIFNITRERVRQILISDIYERYPQ